MKEIRNLILLIAATAAAFLYIGHVVPQIQSEPIEVETEIGQTPDDLVTAGRRILTSDRAQCLTCHSLGEDPKARCPNLESVGQTAAARKSQLDAAQYFVESVYNPNAYIVAGYPKNQMSPVNKPPIVLSDDEILAVIAYMHSLGGVTDEQFVDRVRTAQQPWRDGLLRPQEDADVQQEKLPSLPGEVGRGREAFFAKCARCHRIGALGEDKSPDLTSIGATQGDKYILESILDPPAVMVKGYEDVEEPMPTNFPELMTTRELYDIVAFLLAQRGQG